MGIPVQLRWAIGGVLLLALLVGGITSLMKKGAKSKPSEAGPPVCLLTGDMRNPRKDTQGFENLGNMIRLRFDAEDVDKCKQTVADYCHGRMLEGYTPGDLVMTFRQDPRGNSSEKFQVKGQCTYEKLDSSGP